MPSLNSSTQNESLVVMSTTDYLRSPDDAFRHMRAGATVVIEPSNGYARMVLGNELLSDVDLD
jgi:hypothetical protein